MNKDKVLMITIDTEADWFSQDTNGLTNLENLKNLTELFDRYGFIPTYLITYEVAMSGNYADYLKGLQDDGRCEIGTHFHVWSVPPFNENNGHGVDMELMGGIQSELTDEEFYPKFKTLHDTITERFGRAPTSHRAGRWGIDNRSIKWMAENGYVVDSSICPLVDWTNEKGAREKIKINSYNAPNSPYYPSKNDITVENGEVYNIVEMPVTGIKENAFIGDYSTKFGKKINNLFRNMGLRAHQTMQFRPSYYMPPATYEKITRNLYAQDLRYYNMMFHSSEACLGTAPHSKTEKRYTNLMKRLEVSLKTAKEAGLKGMTLTGAAEKYISEK